MIKVTGKKWYKSATIVGNIIAAVGFFVAKEFGYDIPEDVMALIVTVGNILLRVKTTEPVKL